MKSTKILIAAVAMMTVLFSGCEKEVFTGIDTSKACVEDFNYDDVNSSSNAVAFYWDATKAIKDGATSFSVQLAKEADFRDIDMYDATIGKTVQVSSSLNDAVIFTGLNEYDRYYARVRANYARSIFSDWTILKVDGELACVSVGHGLVAMVFSAPTELKLEAPSYNKVVASWNVIGAADGYVAEYKKGTDSGWTQFYKGDKVSAEITGLTETTAYDVRVKAYRTVDGAEEFSEYITESITTPVKPDFDPQIKTAAQLAEFIADIAAVTGAADSYTIENDIDMTGVTVSSAATFAGILDGKNHSIKNLTISEPLFAENAGAIKNVVLDASCKLEAADLYAPLVNVNKGTLENCKNNAAIVREVGDSNVLLSGLVMVNNGTVKGCEVAGDITVTGGTPTAPVIGGVIAFACGTQESCVYSGKLKVTLAGSASVKSGLPYDTIKATTMPVCGGIAGLSYYGTSKEKGFTTCTNKGSVEVTYTSSGFVRTYVAGIVGNAISGFFNKCVNEGAVTVKFDTGAASSAGKQIWVGGITNANVNEYIQTAGCGWAVITDCTNKGDLTLLTDMTASNNYIGGICGAADSESSAYDDQQISGCVNEGTITAEGYGYMRAAGISGGAANLYKCINKGEVKGGKNIYAASNICGIVAYPNGAGIHPVVECENYGNITCEAVNEVKVGGIFGTIGGTTTGSTFLGNKCNCTITASEVCLVGLLAGSAGNKAYTLGTADSPNKIAGTVVKGSTSTVVTESNYMDFVSGNGIGSSIKAVVEFLK